MKQLLFTCLISLTLFACQEGDDISTEQGILGDEMTKPTEPVFSSSVYLPKISDEVAYVVQREYTLKSGDFKIADKTAYNSYINKRLTDLYPNVINGADLNTFQSDLEHFKILYKEYLMDIGIPNEEIETQFIPSNETFISIENELTSGRLSEEEASSLIRLDELAKSETPLTYEEIIFKLNQDQSITSRSSQSILILPGLAYVALLVGIAHYHVELARDRTEEYTLLYYGEDVEGETSDAFKHIYVSMQLRKYFTKAISKVVMDTWETLNPNNYAGATAMDYHNNHIGRDSKYDEFRGHIILDITNHAKWARNVRDYVNNCRSGLALDLLKNWDRDSDYPLTISHAQNDINGIITQNTKYAYFSETCADFVCTNVSCVSGFTCVNGNCVPETNDGSDDPNDDWTSDDNGDDGGGIGIIRCGSQICDVGYVCVNGQCTPT